MTSQPNRNDPCPCGSGRKYKKCCLLKQQATPKPLTKELLHQASKSAAKQLFEYARKHLGPKPTESLLLCEMPELPTREAAESLQSEVLLPWLLYLYYPREGTSPTLQFPSEETHAARFLAERGDVDGFTRRYIEAACDEPFSYWEIQAVVQGSGLLVKDLFTGRECFVHDISMSNIGVKWEIMLAQVVGLDGMYIFNGVGMYSLPPHGFRDHITGFLQGIKKNSRTRLSPIPALLALQPEIISFYLTCIKTMLNPTLPEVRNMDGEKLVFAESKYAFDPQQRPTVIQRLGEMAEIEQEHESSGKREFSWVASPKQKRHHGPVRKGSIRVGEDHLETECNSEKRDKALRKRLESVLGTIIVHQSTNLRPFEPGRASTGGQSSNEPGSKPLDLASLPAEDRQKIESLLEQHYMKWADEEVPMLGHKTPRDVAKAAGGKKKVAGMINDWENIQARNRHAQFKFDFNKLRASLGIERE